MANGKGVDPQELEFRRQWYEAHATRAEDDPEKYEQASGRLSDFHARAAEALEILNDLTEHRDPDRFQNELENWASGDDYSSPYSFRGAAGTGIIKELVKNADDRAETARSIVDWFSPPIDRSSAQAKMASLAEHLDRISGYPGSGHAPGLLSYFWAMDRSKKWPIFTTRALEFLELIVGHDVLRNSQEVGDRYLQFLDQISELEEDVDRFHKTVDWWDSSGKPVFLDSVFLDRAAFGLDPDAVSADALLHNAEALVAFARYLGERLTDDLADALGYPLSYKASPTRLYYAHGRLRSDFWVDWRFEFDNFGNKRLWQGMGLRLGMNHKGAAIGIVPGWWNQAWYDAICELINKRKPEGFDEILIRDDLPEGERGFLWPVFEPRYSIYGRWYESDQLPGLNLRDEAMEVASAARPTIESMIDWARYWKPLTKAAKALLVDRSFLYDIVGLLEEKGQVILYGPPGTGKTYLAKRLAEALAPDPEFRGLVQFHPSTSYEDFFEGYRPVPAADGGIGYELTRGPLARMAAHAEEQPERHVMVIDEINRANLPRVLGELLFLLEYREERVSTLYRSGGEFCLPESLWFIGTMNTADRSIALVDAALRRRFHFVPFFPDRGSMKGLLERWLEREGQPAWVGGLVAMVNGELAEAVGEDLQLGFSHFMREGYGSEPSRDDKVLRRIWQYNIEPFVEDQLFGDRTRIERFRFESVVSRFRSKTGRGDSPEAREDGGGSDDDQSG